MAIIYVKPPVTNRQPPTGGILNGQNQPVQVTQPTIRTANTRK